MNNCNLPVCVLTQIQRQRKTKSAGVQYLLYYAQITMHCQSKQKYGLILLRTGQFASTIDNGCNTNTQE